MAMLSNPYREILSATAIIRCLARLRGSVVFGNGNFREVYELNGVWSWRMDYIFAGGSHIATVDSAGTKHAHKDHLGSTRLIIRQVAAPYLSTGIGLLGRK